MLAAIAILGVAITGCGQGHDAGSTEADAVAGRRPGMKVARSKVKEKAPSDEACREFAAWMEGSAARGDWQSMNSRFDWASLADGVVDSLDFEPGLAAELKEELVNASYAEQGVFAKLAASMSEDASYSFVGLKRHRGGVRVIFRLTAEDVNFHEYRLVERDGTAFAVDVLVYRTGETFSDTLRRVMLPAAQSLSRTWIDRLTSEDAAYLQNYERLSAMARDVAAGDGRSALRLYRSLPQELRESRPVQLMRIQAAALAADLPEVNVGFEELCAACGGDPSHGLLSYEVHVANSRHQEALASLDTLDKQLGGDPYLDVLRASLLDEMSRPEEAVRLARQAVQNLPGNFDAHAALIDLTQRARDHEGLYEALRGAESAMGFEFEDLRDEPEYTYFVESPYGQRWLREHGMLRYGGVTTVSAVAPADGFLTWAGRTGVAIEAKLIARTPTELQLGTRDGQVLYVPLENLTAASRAQAEGFLR